MKHSKFISPSLWCTIIPMQLASQTSVQQVPQDLIRITPTSTLITINPEHTFILCHFDQLKSVRSYYDIFYIGSNNYHHFFLWASQKPDNIPHKFAIPLEEYTPEEKIDISANKIGEQPFHCNLKIPSWVTSKQTINASDIAILPDSQWNPSPDIILKIRTELPRLMDYYSPNAWYSRGYCYQLSCQYANGERTIAINAIPKWFFTNVSWSESVQNWKTIPGPYDQHACWKVNFNPETSAFQHLSPTSKF